MSELSQSIARLNMKAKTLSRQARESKERWNTLRLPRTEMVLRKLREKADKMIRVDPLDQQVLVKKTVRMYQGSQEEFTRREIRNLPFGITSSELSMPVAKFALRQVDLDKTSCFRRLLFAYFSDYEPKERKTEWIRTVLWKQMQRNDRMGRNIHFLQDFPQLLDKDGVSQMAEFFSEGNLRDALKTLSFPPTLSGSNFVKAAIVKAFQMDIGLDAKQVLLENLTKDQVYKGLVPQVVGPVIINVDEEGSDSAKNWLMQLVFREMGDPRGNNTAWLYVEEKAKEIFLHWLVKNDFAVFFHIIASTADRRWKYRQAFWSAYMDEIRASRIIIGQKAKLILNDRPKEEKSKLMAYDFLEGKSSDTSLLVFTIGQYTFIEVSYNGKLRIYSRAKSPIQIFAQGHRTIPYSHLINSDTEQEFVHTNPMGRGPNWQPKVRNWIYDHCGIWREEQQWKVKV
ncbi:MAG: EH signature domain-containing protein [Dialister sp.]|nr:EH signature domain-containing protein [Dialister sp.]MDY6115083.1 EH signature domain-containing protein [Dialister sp.]